MRTKMTVTRMEDSMLRYSFEDNAGTMFNVYAGSLEEASGALMLRFPETQHLFECVGIAE